VDFANGWLKAQRCDETASDFHLNLLAWSSTSPGQVLGIVLNLIDQAGEDEAIGEAIGLGPVEWLVEKSPATFVPVLREAVRRHSGFELYTRWNRDQVPHHRCAEIRP
jgi:hypothetical protein